MLSILWLSGSSFRNTEYNKFKLQNIYIKMMIFKDSFEFLKLHPGV